MATGTTLDELDKRYYPQGKTYTRDEINTIAAASASGDLGPVSSTSYNPGTVAAGKSFTFTQPGTYTYFKDSSNAAIIIPNPADGYVIVNGRFYNNGTYWLASYSLQNMAGYALQSDLNAFKVSSFTALAGTEEAAKGYYSATTGAWAANSTYTAVKYNITGLSFTNLQATAKTSGSAMALACYYNSSGTFISSQYVGGSSDTTYTRQILTIPAGTAYVGIATHSATVAPVLETYNLTVPDSQGLLNNVSTLQTQMSGAQSDINSLKSGVYTALTGVPQGTQGYYNYSTGAWANQANYFTTVYDISAVTGSFLATGQTSGTLMALVVYFNASMGYLGFEARGGSGTTSYSRRSLTIPANTKFVAVCLGNSSSGGSPVLESYNLVLPNLSTMQTDVNTIKSRNQWAGKKVVWIGTSVSFGYNATKSYAQEAANYLGFNLVNASVPGQAIHGQLISGVMNIVGSGSTCMSIAEYAAIGTTIASSPVTPYLPGGSYNNYYRTWENIFTAGNADADLWVFDVAPNNTTFNTTDWDAFNKTTWAYNDASAFSTHRTTFLGALLFLMDKMYALNPNARMLLVSGSTFNYSQGITAFQSLVAQWQIAYKDIWSKANTSPKSLNVIKSIGGTDNHPSTFAHTALGKIMANELMLIA